MMRIRVAVVVVLAAMLAFVSPAGAQEDILSIEIEGIITGQAEGSIVEVASTAVPASGRQYLYGHWGKPEQRIGASRQQPHHRFWRREHDRCWCGRGSWSGRCWFGAYCGRQQRDGQRRIRTLRFHERRGHVDVRLCCRCAGPSGRRRGNRSRWNRRWNQPDERGLVGSGRSSSGRVGCTSRLEALLHAQRLSS